MSTFSPKNIPGCSLWLDASDNSSIVFSGSNIITWNDKSGYGRNATAVGSLTKSSNNIFFNGSSYFNLNLDFLANQSHMAFIVCNVTNYVNIYGATSGGSGSGSLHIGFNSNSAYRMNYWGNDWYPTFTNFKPSQSNVLCYFWSNNSSKTIYANGGLEGTIAQAGVISTCAGGGSIGNVVSQGIYAGTISEIIFYTSSSGSPLTISDQQKIEGYLAWKWGLQSSFVSSHPYRYNAPPGFYDAQLALSNITTDTTSVSNYVTNTTGTSDNILLNIKSSVKNGSLTLSQKTTAKTQYINSLISKNGSSTLTVSNSSTFFTNSDNVAPGLASKNVIVNLPSISGSIGTLVFPTTANTSNYYHIEMPANTNITLTNAIPSVTLLYDGTTLQYNGITKNIGDFITINSSTYKVVALGSVTLDQQSAGVGGDPHIQTIHGDNYDLPNQTGNYILFNNKKQIDNVRIVAFCDFLNQTEIADSRYINDFVKNGTFIKYVKIYINNNVIKVDMNNLQLVNENDSFEIGEIYEDTNVFEKYYNPLFKIKYNINFNGKSRNIKVKTIYGTYTIKLSLDLNCADRRNELSLDGPELNTSYGALISPKHWSKIC